MARARSTWTRSLLAIVALALLSLLGSATASAQPRPPDASHDAAIPPDASAPTPPPVERTAVVRAESANRAAGQIEIPVGMLANVPRTDPSEILSLVPGVSLTNEQNVGDAPEVFLRGFHSDNGQDEAFSVEGIPLNDESNPLTHGYADTLFLMPEIVQRLDVVEGQGDLRAGNFAIAGSIDFALGLAQRGLTLRTSYGTQGYVRVAGFYGPESMPRETFVGTELVHSDGQGPRRAYDRWSLVAQHVFELAAGWRVRVLGVGYATQWQAPGFVRQDDCPPGSCPDATFFGVYPDTGNQGGFSSRALAAVGLERHGTLEQATVRVFGQLRDFRESANATGFYDDPASGDLRTEQYSGGTFGINGFYRRGVRVGGLLQELELGVVVRHDRYALSDLAYSVFTDAPRSPPGDEDSRATIRVTNPAAYLEGTVRLQPWLVLRGGARLDTMAYDADVTASDAMTMMPATSRVDALGLHVGPKGTLVVGPFRGLELLASMGSGFRSPDARTVNDGGPVEFATAVTEDVTVRYTLPARPGGARLIAALTGFHTAIDHDAIFDPTVGDEVQVGPTDRLGAMLWGRFEPVSWIDVGASVAYTRSTVEQPALSGALAAGAPIPYLPSWIGRIDAAADREVARVRGVRVRVRGGLGASVRGPAPLVRNDASPGTLLLDASVGLRVGLVAFDLAGRNLTDARWHAADYEFASNFHQGTVNSPTPVPTFAAGAPLSVFGTLSLYLDR